MGPGIGQKFDHDDVGKMNFHNFRVLDDDEETYRLEPVDLASKFWTYPLGDHVMNLTRVEDEDWEAYCRLHLEYDETGEIGKNETLYEKYKGKLILAHYLYQQRMDCDKYRAGVFGMEDYFAMKLVLPCKILGAHVVWAESEPGKSMFFGFFGTYHEGTELQIFQQKYPEIWGNCLVGQTLLHTTENEKFLLEQTADGKSLQVAFNLKENSYQKAFAHPLTQFTFVYLFGAIFLALALVTLRVYSLRKEQKAVTNRYMKIVFFINAVVAVVVATFSFLDGYGSVKGHFNIRLVTGMRSFFYGSCVASDVLLVHIYRNVCLQLENGFGEGKKKHRGTWVFPFVAVVLIVLDITSFVTMYKRMNLFGISYEKLYKITPLFFVFIQIMVSIFLTHYSRKISNKLKENTRNIADQSHPEILTQKRLIKRLTRYIRLGSFAAVSASVCLVLIGLQKWYFDNARSFLFISAIFIIARALNSYATIMFCQPPPRKQENRSSLIFSVNFNRLTLTKRKITPFQSSTTNGSSTSGNKDPNVKT